MTRTKIVILVAALAAVALLVWRLESHSPANNSEAAGTRANAAGETGGETIAAVAHVERRTLCSTLLIAGEFKPFQDVDIHAKVAGYIRKIYVDVGDHVREGQTLAVLEVPELAAQVAGAEAAVRGAQEQIRRAQGDLQRAQSTHAAAHSAFTRLKQAADSRAGL